MIMPGPHPGFEEQAKSCCLTQSSVPWPERKLLVSPLSRTGQDDYITPAS